MPTKNAFEYVPEQVHRFESGDLKREFNYL